MCHCHLSSHSLTYETILLASYLESVQSPHGFVPTDAHGSGPRDAMAAAAAVTDTPPRCDDTPPRTLLARLGAALGVVTYSRTGTHPLDRSLWNPVTLVTFFTFGWVSPVVRAGARRPLTQDDLYDIPPRDHAVVMADRMEKAWRAQAAAGKRPTMLRTLLSAFGLRYFGITVEWRLACRL